MNRSDFRRIATLAAILALTATAASASTVIDLTTPGANNFAGNNVSASGATFFVQQASLSADQFAQADPFVRLKDKNGDGSEQGYNTDFRPVQFDEKRSLEVTHSLSLSDVPLVKVDGSTVMYRQFLLDINQTNKQPFLSLNQVQIFLRDFGDLDNAENQFPTTSSTQPPVIAFVDPFSTEVFRLNRTLADDTSFLEIQLKDGDKKNPTLGDMFLYIPDSVFQSVLATNPDRTFVYLYSQFGSPPGQYAADGKFEEWAVLPTTPVPVPEPSTVALAISGLGTLGFAGIRRRCRRLTTST